MLPVFLPPGSPSRFPDPRDADDEGLVAVGGDLTSKRLLAAYDSGVFPWYDEGLPILWWSPDPRAVIAAGRLHVSRRLERRLRQQRFRLTWNQAFEQVMDGCAEGREEGTWITAEMRDAYLKLHRQGHAFSTEVWQGEDLVGGIYGVQRGGLFAAESMFHRVRDASKVGLVACVRSVWAAGIELFDVQLMTPHLESMGAVEWSRRHYVSELIRVRRKEVDLSSLTLAGSF